MKSGDLTELAVRNLREAALRNSLTTLGIAVGVASLVAMLSLGVGLQQLANRRLARSGLFDTVFVTSRANFPGFGRRSSRSSLSSSSNTSSSASQPSNSSSDFENSTKPEIAAWRKATCRRLAGFGRKHYTAFQPFAATRSRSADSREKGT